MPVENTPVDVRRLFRDDLDPVEQLRQTGGRNLALLVHKVTLCDDYGAVMGGQCFHCVTHMGQ